MAPLVGLEPNLPILKHLFFERFYAKNLQKCPVLDTFKISCSTYAQLCF